MKPRDGWQGSSFKKVTHPAAQSEQIWVSYIRHIPPRYRKKSSKLGPRNAFQHQHVDTHSLFAASFVLMWRPISHLQECVSIYLNHSFVLRHMSSLQIRRSFITSHFELVVRD